MTAPEAPGLRAAAQAASTNAADRHDKQQTSTTEAAGFGVDRGREPAHRRNVTSAHASRPSGDRSPSSLAEVSAQSDASVDASAQQVELKSFQHLSAQELYGILQLRAEVFVVEQNCSYLDLDGADLYPETLHAIVPGVGSPAPFRDSHGGETGLTVKPRGYARLLPLGLVDGPAGDPEGRSIGRVVCDPRERSAGVASAIISRLISDFGGGLLTLNAQAHLKDFYGRFGFQQSGDPFDEDGIPHLPMRRAPDR